MKENKKTSHLITNAPEQEEISVNTEMNSKFPFQSERYQHGDSVAEHKNLEEANLFLNKGEIGQQRENN